MNDPRFGLQTHLDTLYTTREPRFPFRAESAAEVEQWQTQMRGPLRQLLGLENRPAVPVRAEKLDAMDRGTYIEEKYALDSGEGVLTPMYVLVPKREPPFKAILALPGHDPSVQTILGNEPDAAVAQRVRETDGDYARLFAGAGYLVCVIEQRGFGERVTTQVTDDYSVRSCRHLALSYLMQGRTLVGERVWDAMCALNYLETRADVAQGGFGATGHSGGGTTTLFLAALDSRITAAVISGYFCSFGDSILGMVHCECNYVPHLLELGEMGEIAALIAPRVLGIVHGAHDPIYPVTATRAQFETVKLAYERCGAADACMLTIHEGAHQYAFAPSRAWLDKTL